VSEALRQIVATFAAWLAALFSALIPAAADAAIPADAGLYRSAITRSAQYHFGIPAPVPALAAQIMQESGFDPNARSRVGALGFAQFMPATADDVAAKIGTPAAPLSPGWAIFAQHFYMAELLEQVDYANECDDFAAALSAYNGGLRWHNKRKARAERPGDFWNSVRTVNPGITPGNQRENEDYPVRILRHWQPQFATWGGKYICQRP